jgi:hypothetical protein
VCSECTSVPLRAVCLWSPSSHELCTCFQVADILIKQEMSKTVVSVRVGAAWSQLAARPCSLAPESPPASVYSRPPHLNLAGPSFVFSTSIEWEWGVLLVRGCRSCKEHLVRVSPLVLTPLAVSHVLCPGFELQPRGHKCCPCCCCCCCCCLKCHWGWGWRWRGGVPCCSKEGGGQERASSAGLRDATYYGDVCHGGRGGRQYVVYRLCPPYPYPYPYPTPDPNPDPLHSSPPPFE